MTMCICVCVNAYSVILWTGIGFNKISHQKPFQKY